MNVFVLKFYCSFMWSQCIVYSFLFVLVNDQFNSWHIYHDSLIHSCFGQHSRLSRPISKIRMILLMDAKTWMTSLIIIPPETKFRGVYWIHPVRPSVCPSVCLSVCPSVRPSVRPWVGVRMITLILFSGFKIFFYIYHLGQDLAWDWISASYLIKYAHTGRSCDLLIFGIPEVNFLVRVFQFGMKGVLSRIYDINPGFCWIPIFVFFLNFLRVS